MTDQRNRILARVTSDPGFRTIMRVASLGLCTDEWSLWNQGQCGIYALALIAWRPTLRFGSVCDQNGPYHHFAHDDDYAWDSSGRHTLPYLGLSPEPHDFMELDGNPLEHGLPEDMASANGPESDLADATDHIRRNHILDDE